MTHPKINKEAFRDDLRYVQRQMTNAGYYKGAIDGLFWDKSKAALVTMAQAAVMNSAAGVPMARKLTDQDIREVAETYDLTFAQIKAVIKVESGGGWFEDIRKDILDLDGPGGFIDGDMPKILFEAHWFSRITNRRYDKTHPHISSPRWNRKLYKGGQAEYTRLHEAMQLDRSAALKSASYGMFQIMGFNHMAAGYVDVESFVAAMKVSERKHLEAFISFIKTERLINALRANDWVKFAKGYNGSGYAANDYDGKLRRAHEQYV